MFSSKLCAYVYYLGSNRTIELMGFVLRENGTASFKFVTALMASNRYYLEKLQ